MPSILFVFTSAEKTLRGNSAGWYLAEAAHPYWILSPHFDIDFAAPKGPNPPIAEASVKAAENDEKSLKFLEDPIVKAKLANAKKLSDVQASDHEAVFYVEGHGPVLDLAFDDVNAKLASDSWQARKVVSAVCHGPGALVKAVDASGKSIFAGRNVTALSNSEEELIDGVEDVPFSLEDKIVELGAKYEKAQPFGVRVVVDGKLVTGQNPASSERVAEEVLGLLKA